MCCWFWGVLTEDSDNLANLLHDYFQFHKSQKTHTSTNSTPSSSGGGLLSNRRERDTSARWPPQTEVCRPRTERCHYSWQTANSSQGQTQGLESGNEVKHSGCLHPFGLFNLVLLLLPPLEHNFFESIRGWKRLAESQDYRYHCN